MANPKICWHQLSPPLGGGEARGTPTPNQNENAKTTAPSNFDAEAFGDMFSTLYNRIWSSANSFFRNNRVRPFFACLLEHWLTYSPQCSLNWSVLQNFSSWIEIPPQNTIFSFINPPVDPAIWKSFVKSFFDNKSHLRFGFNRSITSASKFFSIFSLDSPNPEATSILSKNYMNLF